VKRFRSVRRRVLAVAASAAVGLVGAVVLASPASAHHSEVKGVPVCDTETGEWVVTWTVTSIAPPRVTAYRLLEVQVKPDRPVSNITATVDDEDFPYDAKSPLVGEQRVPGDATSASLGVRAEWNVTGYTELRTVWGEVTFGGPCEVETPPPGPAVSDVPTCDDLTVVVTNPADGAPVTVTVTTSAGDEVTEEVAPGDDFTPTFPAEEGLTYKVTVDGEELGAGEWQQPEDCEEPEVVKVPIASRPDCDTLTVEVTNPLEDQAIEATLSDGDQTETLTIEPGDTGEATFDAEEGTVVTVTIGDQSEEVAWTEPADCDGAGGGLPVTGASTGLVAGAALALLALGGGLFLVARRRRITFTA
jgi:LPXTG-motif cell wall-anchored protein